MGRFDPPRIPCPYDYPDNCMCNTCVNDRGTTSSYAEHDRGWVSGGGMNFKGYPIKVLYGATGRGDRFEFLYGGRGAPDGPGHGHVVSNDGENIHYWKEPNASHPIIDDRWSFEKLSTHSL